MYDIVYQILNILSHIYHFTKAKMSVSKNNINAPMKIWTSTLFFFAYHIWTNVDTVGLNSGLSLNLHQFFVYRSSDDSGKSTH